MNKSWKIPFGRNCRWNGVKIISKNGYIWLMQGLRTISKNQKYKQNFEMYITQNTSNWFVIFLDLPRDILNY